MISDSDRDLVLQLHPLECLMRTREMIAKVEDHIERCTDDYEQRCKLEDALEALHKLESLEIEEM